MSRRTGPSSRPSQLSSWYTSLPPPRSEANLTEKIIVTLVAKEVTSPQTIVVASDPQSESITHAKCSGRSINVRKGEKFNLNIDIQPYRDETGRHLPGAVDSVGPPSKFYIKYEDSEALSTQAQTTSNTDARLTVRGGKCQGLAANSWDILNLQHIQLLEVAIHSTGHYYLYLIIEKENSNGSQDLLAKIRTRKVKVSR
ncbi:uncharacterized protein GGS22DRAFT_191442 [Annulohypoxylon maeteangense]|uniref:uncharacterized protein n=1 Tax=Annulohypoxylon maeteangense TaxID=1927788 RepID=UPI002008587E|nr:uncharacterized protein GGS22DRAFT_191442 [Annulohypoxylon maeteangense]KAI0882273.1 hypothetical protein GGS22DRAFT_191442 [Annulohypoxylon maeteangense]